MTLRERDGGIFLGRADAGEDFLRKGDPTALGNRLAANMRDCADGDGQSDRDKSAEGFRFH